MRGKRTATALRKRRHERVRKTVTGTAERPRLAVYRSLNHIYAQVIDDTAGHTVAAASDQDAEVRKEATKKKKTDVAGLVGAALGQRAKEKGITAVVFDRGGFRYHGRVKALAEAVRKAGVTF
jgi:ribosomal protein L18, bacterial type